MLFVYRKYVYVRELVNLRFEMKKFTPRSRTLPKLLQEVAEALPNNEAIVGARTRLTYAELTAEARKVAKGLYASGVRRGDKVGILMGNCPEWIVSALGITTLGAVIVGLNTWSTKSELEYLLSHSDTKVLIADPVYLKKDFGQMIEALRDEGKLPELNQVISVKSQGKPATWMPFDQLIILGSRADGLTIDAAAGAVDPDDVALLIYTSGSTSRPKGVQLLHGKLITNTWNIGERQGADQSDRLWLAVSLFWGFGCSNAWPNMLSHGGCVVLQESFDAAEALTLIEEERCTLFYGTPNMAQAMLEHPDRPHRDLSSLRSGGALGTEKQMRRVIELGASEICNIYGLTEIYGNCYVTDHKAPLERRMTSVGQALPGVEGRIVDTETGEECAVGEVGEIRLKGFTTPGYYKNPQATAEAYDELGFLKTGDLGFLDDEGYLHYRGRLKEVVKTGGMLVSPAEVEMVLMKHYDVRLAIVVGIPDEARDEILAVVVVPETGRALSEEALIAFCKQHLASYKVPRRFVGAKEADFPLTTTGKIQRNKVGETFFGVATAQLTPGKSA